MPSEHRGVVPIGRTAVSKTDGWGFESLHPCHFGMTRTPARSEITVPSSTIRTNIDNKQMAQLSALGIVVYKPINKIMLQEQTWLVDVCKLLGITLNDCIFDASEPSFDEGTKTLHLPSFSYAKEAELKKSIWHTIRPFTA